MTNKEKRAILEALALWDPRLTGPILINDQLWLREQVAQALEPITGIDLEQAITIMDSTRMTRP